MEGLLYLFERHFLHKLRLVKPSLIGWAFQDYIVFWEFLGVLFNHTFKLFNVLGLILEILFALHPVADEFASNIIPELTFNL